MRIAQTSHKALQYIQMLGFMRNLHITFARHIQFKALFHTFFNSCHNTQVVGVINTVNIPYI